MVLGQANDFFFAIVVALAIVCCKFCEGETAGRNTSESVGLVPIEIIVGKLNQIARGWSNYFHYGHGHRKMKKSKGGQVIAIRIFKNTQNELYAISIDLTQFSVMKKSQRGLTNV